MNLLVFDPASGVILSEGIVSDEYALPASELPEGSAYVDQFPVGPLEDWRYQGGRFVPAPKDKEALE